MEDSASKDTSALATPTASASAPLAKSTDLSGWGRYPIAHSDVCRPEKLSELAAVVGDPAPTHLIARGAGRAYGDAAINDHARVLDAQRINRMLGFDPATGILQCEAGVTIAEIIETFLPRGWFMPVTPGTKFVTIGGSIAADVHGKNHHRDRSLGSHVVWISLMLANGEIARCSRDHDPDLFWATIGGMGLTGVIIETAIRLKRVASAWFDGEVFRARDLDEALERFEREDARYGYSVGWIDCLGSGATLGRSVITFGNVAERDALPATTRDTPFEVPRRLRASVPINFPGFALSKATVKAFNAMWFATHRDSGRVFIDYESFFYPLDMIHDWHRIYGKRGFTQYQCVWPLAESRAGLIEVLEAIARAGLGSFLTVIKRFGPQEGMLSFPMPGYTLALDFPITPDLFPLLDRLDQTVLARGGRVYLAKDSRMKPETFKAMYSEFPRWYAIKRRVDPDNRFSSSLSRRLKMDIAS